MNEIEKSTILKVFDIEKVAKHIMIINYKEIEVMFNELNNGRRTVKEGIDTKKYDFVPLRDFIGKVIKVDGFFFTNSKYGKQVVVVGNGCNINMPKRATETFETIQNNDAMIKAVLEGHLEIIDIQNFSTDKGNDTVTYTLHDC